MPQHMFQYCVMCILTLLVSLNSKINIHPLAVVGDMHPNEGPSSSLCASVEVASYSAG